MTDLKRTEQPDNPAVTDLAERLRERGDKVLAPTLWPTKAQPRRVRFLRWQWQVLDEVTGGVLDEGYAPSKPLAWTRTDRAAKRIRDERAAARQAES